MPSSQARWVSRLLGDNYAYPVWNRAMEVVGLFAYAAFFVLLGHEVGVQLGDVALGEEGDAWTWAALALAVGLALLAGDFMSGFVHCAADNFGHPDTPFFGVAFIMPFREHHRDPAGITQHDFVETNGNSAIACLLALVPTWLSIRGGAAGLPGIVIGAFVLGFSTAIMLTNQIHKWAHMPAPPRLVAGLQRAGVILSPGHHQRHHTAPFDSYYCITTGWMNGPIERTGVFAWMVRTFGRK